MKLLLSELFCGVAVAAGEVGLGTGALFDDDGWRYESLLRVNTSGRSSCL